MKTCISQIALCLLIAMPAAGWAQQRGECNRTPLPDKIFKALEAGKFQTVVVYGTSVTINGQWSKEMEAYFETLYPGQVNFFNSAKAGMHSNWGVKNLKERVLDKKPDLVFLEFSINDAATKHGISIQNSQRNLDTMVRMLREQNPQAELVLQTMNPAWDSPHVSKTYGSDRPNLEDYYEVNRRYARVHELPLVDNYLVWKKIMDEEPERYQEMVPDGIHPNSGPSREIAWLTIKELLDRARALAGGDLIVNVWPEGKMPGTHADFPESLRSPERTDAIRITNISEPTLTLFPVKGISDSAPAMIVCPGGGYSYVGVDKEGSDIAK